jgi:hypothetical protein
MYRLSATLVSRLVLNLREQNAALAGLPTTVETELRFQGALPVVGPTPPRNTTFARVDMSTLGTGQSSVVSTSH